MKFSLIKCLLFSHLTNFMKEIDPTRNQIVCEEFLFPKKNKKKNWLDLMQNKNNCFLNEVINQIQI